MSSVLLLVSLVGAAIAWRVSMGATHSAQRATVIVTLAAVATTFNVVMPVSNVEATTLVVVCAALTLGMSGAVLTGVLCVLGTGLAGGLGPWTGWQIVGFAIVAAIAVASSVVGPSHPAATRRWRIALVIACATVAYDVVVTAGTIGTIGVPQSGSTADAIAAALLLGLPFTITHVVGNILMGMLGAPSLLAALERAGERIRIPGGAGAR